MPIFISKHADTFGETNRVHITANGQSTGFVTREGSTAEAIRVSLDVSGAEGSVRSSCKATPYNPFTITDLYLEYIESTDNQQGGVIAGKTPRLNIDGYSKDLAGKSRDLLRALIATVAVSGGLGYEDADLTRIPAGSPLEPLRTMIPTSKSILENRRFDANSKVRTLYITLSDGKRVAFAFASPYSLLAPIFDGIDVLFESRMFPWFDKHNDQNGQMIYEIKDPATLPLTQETKNAIARFAEQMAQEIVNRVGNMGSPKATLYAAILYSLKNDMNAVETKDDYSALCDIILQTNDNIATNNPFIVSVTPQLRYVPVTTRGVVRVSVVDGAGVEHKAIADMMQYVRQGGDISQDEIFRGQMDMRVYIKGNTYGDTIKYGSYTIINPILLHEIKATPQIANFRICGDKVSFTCHIKVRIGEKDEYLVCSREYTDIQLYIAQDKLISDIFLPAENVTVYQASEYNTLVDPSSVVSGYLVAEPISKDGCDIEGIRTSIENFRDNGNGTVDYSFSVCIPLEDGQELSFQRQYADVFVALKDDMTNVAMWPPVRIPNCKKYFIFNSAMNTSGPHAIVTGRYPTNPVEALVHDFNDGLQYVCQEVKEYPEYLYLYDSQNPAMQQGRIKVKQVDAETQGNAGKEVEYAIDLGTSNTAIYTHSEREGYKKFNEGGHINSVAYAQDTDMINAFFIPCTNLKSTFQTLMYMKREAANCMLTDFFVYFRNAISGSEDAGAIGRTKEKMIGQDGWDLKTDIKWTENSCIEQFLTQLLAMVLVEARQRRADSIKVYFTYPLAFNDDDMGRLETGIAQARIRLKGEEYGAFGTGYEIGENVKVNIDESQASIFYCRASNKMPICDGQGIVAVLDVGGGTTDIAVALVNSKNYTVIDTTSLKVGARKMFISNLYNASRRSRDAGDTLMGRAQKNNIVDTSNAYKADIDALYHAAINNEKKVFTAEFESMLSAEGGKLANNLYKFQMAKLYQDSTTDKLRIIRTIMALDLLLMSYVAGLLVRRQPEDTIAETIGGEKRVVFAGNGSRLFGVLSEPVQNQLITMGFNIGMAPEYHAPARLAGIDRILCERNEEYIKMEAAYGALLGKNLGRNLGKELEKEAEVRLNLKGNPTESAPIGDRMKAFDGEDYDVCKNISVYDYIRRGKPEVDCSESGMPSLRVLLASYNDIASVSGNTLYAIRIGDADATDEDVITISRTNMNVRINGGSIAGAKTVEGIELSDGKLKKYAEKDRTAYGTADVRNAESADIGKLMEIKRRTDRVTPIQMEFDAICMLLSQRI